MPSFDAEISARKTLLKQGRLEQACALTSVVAGGFAVGERWTELSARVCKLCGQHARDDLARRYYECSCLSAIPDDQGYLASTNWIAKKVRREWRDMPCYWSRAFLLANFVYRFQRNSRALLGTSANFPPLSMQTGQHIFTDGAGGPRAVPHASVKLGLGPRQVSWQLGTRRVLSWTAAATPQ